MVNLAKVLIESWLILPTSWWILPRIFVHGPRILSGKDFGDQYVAKILIKKCRLMKLTKNNTFGFLINWLFTYFWCIPTIMVQFCLNYDRFVWPIILWIIFYQFYDHFVFATRTIIYISIRVVNVYKSYEEISSFTSFITDMPENQVWFLFR